MFGWYKRTILPKMLNRSMGSRELEATRRAVVGGATGTVLELGAGAGHNLRFYSNVSKLYALEPAAELRALAEQKAAGLPYPVEFLTAGAEHIPLPDQSIDTVVSTWTLCSVADPAQALREVARVLRPGGTFLFVDHGAATPKPFVHRLQHLLTPATRHFTGNCHMDRRIEQLIRESGLTLQSLTHPPEISRPLIYNYQGVATK